MQNIITIFLHKQYFLRLFFINTSQMVLMTLVAFLSDNQVLTIFFASSVAQYASSVLQ